MLGRAVNNYQPPPPQRDAAVAARVAALKPASSSQEPQKGVEDMMKEAPNKKKGSISGWTSSGSINKAAPRPFARTTSSSGYETLPGTYAAHRQANELKRPHAAVDNEGATAARIAASRQAAIARLHSWSANAPKELSSFGDGGASRPGASSQSAINVDANIVDLTRDEAPQKSQVPTSFVELDLTYDDYENDSEIDLDMEYALPLPKAAQSAPSQPLQSVPVNKSMPSNTPPAASMLPPKTPKVTSHGLPIPSSATSWPSSSPSNFQPPPRMQSIEEPLELPPVPSKASSDTSSKRRISPWLQGAQAGDHQKRLASTITPDNAASHSRIQNDAVTQWTHPASSIRDKRQKDLKDQQRKAKAKNNSEAMKGMWKDGKRVHEEKTSKRVVKSTNLKPEPIYLSNEQQKVLQLVTKDKKSVFFTGSAGTGKSVLMRAIIGDLRKTHMKSPESVAVTASTGLAACNIGGVTLHSFSGGGLCKEAVNDLVKKIMRNPKAKKRWLTCKVLIIDEISMVDGDFFDKLEGIARTVRKNSKPFGGIQLVVTGDFFQLPPVPDYGNRSVKFAFDADTWETSIHHTIGLTEVFRQRDPAFANMLNEMRLGKLSDQTLKAFRALDRPLSGGNIDATELFPTRNEVENANFMRLRDLKGRGKVYVAEDGGTVKDKQQLERLLSNFMAPKTLELKKGAQVMLIKNMNEALVNGSLGRVVRFATEEQFSMYSDGKLDQLYDSEDESSQDTLSKQKRDRSKSVSVGGAGGPTLVATTQGRFPVVSFQLPDGDERELLLLPEDWKVELPNGEVQAQRRQIPLILAWALSIHKAQGQTLERVKVDLKRIFENGQAYVALSRATTQEGLWVQNFNAKAVMAHPRVAMFYNSLYSVNKALKHPRVCEKPKETGECPPELEMPGSQVQGDDCFDEEEEAMNCY